MAQANLKLLVAAPTALDIATDTFAAAFAAFQTAVEAHGFNKTESKATQDALGAAERVAAWALFDMALVSADPKAEAESGARSLAVAKGVKEAGLPVYAQRGRDMVTLARAACDAADRSKASPFTVAKRQRDKASASATATAENAPVISEAMERAAGVLETTQPELMARMLAGDQLASEAVTAAIAEVKAERQTLAALRAIMARAGSEEAFQALVRAAII